MSEAGVRDHVIAPMIRLFNPPRKMSVQGTAEALRQYVDALAGFDDDTLKGAWKAVRDEHIRSTWPAIAVLVKACHHAKKVTAPPRAPANADDESHLFARCCELNGLKAHLMRRPNLWWLRSRDLWESSWRENEVPRGERPNMRNADGSMAEDTRLV